MRFLLPLALLILAATAACASEEPPVTVPAGPTATMLPVDLTARARSSILPRLGPQLKNLVNNQPWIDDVSQAEFDLLGAIRDCEDAAEPRGEQDSVVAMLEFAAEQPWMQDGLDDSEAEALAGAFTAYEVSLSKRNSFPIGPMIANTLRQASFAVVPLQDGGNMTVLVASDDEALGKQALDLAVEALPNVESVTGSYPYEFLYIEVTSDLGEYLGGVNLNQFIAISSDSVDKKIMTHEMTHASMYGIFPTWFEEGLAYFTGIYFSTDDVEADIAEWTDGLRELGYQEELDLRLHSTYSPGDYYAAFIQGLVFVYDIYQIEGIDGLGHIVKTLRTKTYSDQELLRAILERGSPENKKQLEALICEGVLGVRITC